MMKFFRKIRQNFIEKENLKRYLLYAVGEILLVMIGILLALQVNNWNEEKKSNIKTIIYKEKIIADLKLDTSNMNRLISLSTRIQGHVNSYFDYFEQGGHSVDEMIDSSANVRWRYFQYLPNNSTMIDLQFSGNIGLLKEEHRKSLFDLANKQVYLQDIINKRILDVKNAIYERNKYLDFDPSESNFFEIVGEPNSKDTKVKGLLQQHNVFKEVLGFTGQMISFGSSVSDRTERCLEILIKN